MLTLPILPNRLIGNSQSIDGATEDLDAYGLAIGWNHIFSPQLISETHLGFTRQRTFFPNALQGTNAAAAAGIANVNSPEVAYAGGLPILSIGGFTSLGESNIQPFITVANKGTRMMYTSNINQADPGPGAIAARRPFSAWADITSMYMDGMSNFNSLQAKMQKRFSHGYTFLAGYTWSKSIDNARGEAGTPMIVKNTNLDRARSDYDVRQRFILSGTFELPFGKGKPVGSDLRGLAGALAEGWMMSPIFSWQTGLPFTPTLVTSVANTGTFSRPDRLADGTLENRTADRWFDPSAFATPAIYTFGNAGRNILTGPGTCQLDISFQKTIYFGENRSRNLQFRAEFFNLANTPQLNNPDAGIGSPTVGRITSAGDRANFSRTSRQIQFGLKFYF